MKRIASRDNPQFKALRALATDAAARCDAGVALLEGIHLADALVRSGGVATRIVVGESGLDNAEVIDLLDRMGGIETLVLADGLFAAVSQLVQGVPVLTIIARPDPTPPGRLLRDAVLLDRIQDPGNVGSILRSAAAAGITEVYLSPGCATAWSPKVLRAGMGAHFHLSIFEACDLVRLRTTASIPCLATSSHAERTIHATDLTTPVAWVFGNEGQGLDADWMDDATTVRIPQPGGGESLNVAAAAAVCFFELVRQRLG